jgi:5'-3' exonuclease
METRHFPTNTKVEREMAFDNIPVIYRAEEHYVNPRERGWEARYYRVAFHLDTNPTKEYIGEVCQNYLEGLEWVFKYYTEGCPHWRWRYRYHYPPLFRDLIEYVPDFETTFIDSRISGLNRPFRPQTQLAYVIPEWNHQLLEDKTRRSIKKLGIHKYYERIDQLKFQWTFCRYFWESHAVLRDIPLEELETLDRDAV